MLILFDLDVYEIIRSPDTGMVHANGGNIKRLLKKNQDLHLGTNVSSIINHELLQTVIVLTCIVNQTTFYYDITMPLIVKKAKTKVSDLGVSSL